MIAENISTVKIIQVSLICKGTSALGRRIWIFYQPVTSIQWHKMNSNGRLIEIRKYNFGILKVHVLVLNERLKHVLSVKCSRLISRICVNGGWGNVLNFPEKHGNLFHPLGYYYKCQKSHQIVSKTSLFAWFSKQLEITPKKV